MCWFNFRKTELPQEIKEVEVFNLELKNLIDSDNYISRKDYMFLFDEHEKTHNYLCAIKNLNALTDSSDKYTCKNKEISAS